MNTLRAQSAEIPRRLKAILMASGMFANSLDPQPPRLIAVQDVIRRSDLRLRILLLGQPIFLRVRMNVVIGIPHAGASDCTEGREDRNL